MFHTLREQGVALEGMLLKPNMVLSGKACARQAGIPEVAAATVRCLRRAVPVAMPGVVFLSGGQSEERATAHLNVMNAPGTSHPWALSFSYGRALQESALRAWRGDPARAEAGQQAFYHRARMNGAARRGQYTPDLERAVA